jgi:hypothetical protein
MAYKTKSSPLAQASGLTFDSISRGFGQYSSTQRERKHPYRGVQTAVNNISNNSQDLNNQNNAFGNNAMQTVTEAVTNVNGSFTRNNGKTGIESVNTNGKPTTSQIGKWQMEKAKYEKDLAAKNARNNPYDVESNFIEPFKPTANGQRNPWDKILNPLKQMNPKATGSNAVVKGVFGQEQIPGSYNRSMSPLNQTQDINPILPPPTNSEPVPPPSTVQQAVAPTYDLSNT